MATLLVGTDFSERSDRAMRRATLLAKRNGYELLLVHIVDDRSSSPDPMDDFAKAHELLAKTQRTLGDVDGVTCRTEVRLGSVGEELCRAAREAEAELTLIGPHRKSLLKDWFAGSTAEHILKCLEMPLIVVNAVPAEDWRRFLLPVDFGPAARRAAEAASNLPFVQKSRLSFVHVYDAEARQMLSRAFVQEPDRAGYLRTEAASARSRLVEFVDGLGCGRSSLLVRESGGSTAKAIVQVANDESTDLIIVSSSNKGTIEQAMVGSVTAGLLGDASQDIMIVPARL